MATVRNRSDGKWYLYNDDKVYQVRLFYIQVADVPKMVMNQSAYVLFYQRKSSENFFR